MTTLIFFAIILIFGATDSYPLKKSGFTDEELNDRPIVAVLAQATKAFEGYSYIAASYIKYLESAGARVVPIPESFTQEEVENVYKYVNGVFFPGGGTKWLESSYYKNAVKAIQTSIEARRTAQDYFPVWGTCLGYETLNVIIANSSDVLSHFAADDVSLTLNYTHEAKDSRLFRNCPTNIRKGMATEDVTYNHHSYGVSPHTHTTNKKINGFFKILSTSKDTNGKDFVSSIEAYDYPIYGTQWHPEKNNFEFRPNLHINHSKFGVLVSQYMANFFVNEARKSKRRFPSRDIEENYLIYQYNPKHTGVGNSTLKAFEQIYLFEN